MEPFEEEIRTQGFRFIAGLDEAGRGPLAGPVVAAAVVLPEKGNFPGIDDSKKLSPAQREKAFALLLKEAKGIGLGLVEAEEIDRINILRASLKAMERAVQNLSWVPDFLLIDGIFSLNLPFPQRTIPKGDQRCLSVAAASIIAKVTRDRLMVGYHRQYPKDNFARHKGYATQEHLRAIRQNGCCPLHRKSFRSVYPFPLL